MHKITFEWKYSLKLRAPRQRNCSEYFSRLYLQNRHYFNRSSVLNHQVLYTRGRALHVGHSSDIHGTFLGVCWVHRSLPVLSQVNENLREEETQCIIIINLIIIIIFLLYLRSCQTRLVFPTAPSPTSTHFTRRVLPEPRTLLGGTGGAGDTGAVLKHPSPRGGIWHGEEGDIECFEDCGVRNETPADRCFLTDPFLNGTSFSKHVL
ncbi:hypothetical protein F7725_026172 [Dissostichus mawsoni]|uniref:Uncharacterized protein n=1 Tax=Dissostichus mawsoni TaxID=36200 RepID=A0A7J5X778_DISMA|nr:hypothetical protein F7725_026172 [Dissostichus mawsoni]